ncbi:hypothetical protein HDU86_005732 [Geranomyces michiganensis]|nr:hypothetical protein HDU86_005732 [Geranomyces michiganensis]
MLNLHILRLPLDSLTPEHTVEITMPDAKKLLYANVSQDLVQYYQDYLDRRDSVTTSEQATGLQNAAAQVAHSGDVSGSDEPGDPY